MQLRFKCHGHPNIRASHAKTLELTRDLSITQKGTCIVGVGSNHVDADLLKLRGRLSIKLKVDDITDTFEADACQFFLGDDSLVIRRGGPLRQRTFASRATKGSSDLDRALVDRLRLPGAVLEVCIEDSAGSGRTTGGPGSAGATGSAEGVTGDGTPFGSVTFDPAGTGALWVVSTPIGNDDDLSQRARSVLENVDLVLAEDTRRLVAMARRTGMNIGSVNSHHLLNEHDHVDVNVRRLLNGERLALVSDAGTPLASDPGFPLVRAAVEAGIPVVPVPGPSAMLAALVGSGLPATRILFDGYPPRRHSQRRLRLAELDRAGATVILLESPRRITALVEDIVFTMGSRQICIAREVTKVHEQFLKGPADEILDYLRDADPLPGEITVVVGPNQHPSASYASSGPTTRDQALSHGAISPPPGEFEAQPAGDVSAGSGNPASWRLASTLAESGVGPSIIAKALETSMGLSRNQAYRMALDAKAKAESEPSSSAT